MQLNIVGKLRRSALTMPLAALAATLMVGINEAAYHYANDALVQLSARGDTRRTIQDVWRGLLDAEAGQRGYLLTTRPEFRRPYDNAVDVVQEALQSLTRYYDADAAASTLVGAIRIGSVERLSELATTLDLHEQGKEDAWRQIVLTDIGREKMDALRARLEQLLALESSRVGAQRAALFRTLRASRIGVNVMAALGLLALCVFLRQTSTFDRLQRAHARSLQAERDGLAGEVTRRTADLTELAQHLQLAREDERGRLGRELHDELGALMTAAKLDTARLKRSIGAMPRGAEARLVHLNETVNRGIELKRRMIEDLRPSSLSNLGLVAALEILTREFAQRSTIPVRAQLQPVNLADSAQTTVFRLVQEALANTARHADAAQIDVTLRRDGARAHVQVRDDGKGYDPGATRGSSHGLLGMHYRVEAEGGVLRVQSQAGSGTTVEAWIPLVAADAETQQHADAADAPRQAAPSH